MRRSIIFSSLLVLFNLIIILASANPIKSAYKAFQSGKETRQTQSRIKNQFKDIDQKYARIAEKIPALKLTRHALLQVKHYGCGKIDRLFNSYCYYVDKISDRFDELHESLVLLDRSVSAIDRNRDQRENWIKLKRYKATAQKLLNIFNDSLIPDETYEYLYQSISSCQQ